jgi:hypothetical protein
MSEHHHPKTKDWALLATLTLLFGTSYALIAVAVETIPPLTIVPAGVGLSPNCHNDSYRTLAKTPLELPIRSDEPRRHHRKNARDKNHDD